MDKFYNNKVFEGITKITDVMLIGFYFIFCSIPIFTIGASLTALYYATHKCIYKGKCIKAVHAEINALIQASAEEMKGATIYITCSPCSNCQLAIMNSGITRVVYDEYHQAKIDWIKGKILCEQIHVDSDISIENICKDNSNKEPFNKEHIDEFGHVYVDFFNSKDGITFKDYLNECNIDTSTDIDTLNEVDELNKSFDLSTITCDNKFFDVHVDVKDESTETLDKVLASHKR